MEKEKVKYGEKKWVIWHDMKGERERERLELSAMLNQKWVIWYDMKGERERERNRLQISAADVEPKFL